MKRILTILFLLIPVFSAVLKGPIFYAVFTIYLLIAYLKNPRSFKVLRKRWFWLTVFIVVFSYPLIMPEKDIKVFGTPLLSSKYLLLGIQIGITGVVMFVWIHLITREISPHEIAGFFKKLGMREIGILVSIAMNLVPIVVEDISTIYTALRLKGGFRLSPRRFYTFVLTIFRNIVLMAENLTIALSLEESNDFHSNR